MRAARQLSGTDRLKALLSSIFKSTGQLHVFRLQKIFYFAEWEIIRRTGVPFTEVDLVRLPQGPVMEDYKKIVLPRLQSEGFLKSEQDSKYENGILLTLVDTEEYQLPHSVKEASKAAIEFVNSVGLYDAEALREAAYQTPPMKRIVQFETKQGTNIKGHPIFDSDWVLPEDFLDEQLYESFYAWNRRMTFGDASMRKQDIVSDLILTRRLVPFRP